MYLLLLVLLFIIHGSLYPWHFDFSRGGADPFPVLLESWPRHWDYYAILDAVKNVVLYFPLGMAAYLAAVRKVGAAAAIAAALALGVALSTTLELIQVYIPGRTGSICDLLFNFGGTIFGTFLARRFRLRFQRVIDATSRHWNPGYASPPALLLACWTSYQLYPCVPQFTPASIPFEAMFLLNPRQSGPNPTYWPEVLTATAEWFCVALAIRALAGRMRPIWIIEAVFFRLAVRPFLLTRPFARDELFGAALALLLWVVLSEEVRRRAGFGMLVLAVVLRQFTALHFSRLTHSFGPVGFILRTLFDYGAVVWLTWILYAVRRQAARRV